MEGKLWKASRRKYGVAIINYKSRCRGSLSLKVGDTVHIIEEYGSGQSGWFRGHLLSNRNQVGIFPMMYIHTKDCDVENAGQYETVTAREDPMAIELTFTLKEWWVAWKKMYLKEGHTTMLDQIYNTMKDLILLRGKLMSNILTDDSTVELKNDIAEIIDWGNGQLGMDLIPRVDGQQVDVEKCSIVRLYRVHLQSAENAKSNQPQTGRKRSKSVQIERRSKDAIDVFNILVSFKIFQCSIGDESQIVMNIYDSRNQKFISEQYEIKMNKNGAPIRPERINNCFGLFTDLPIDDYEKYLYIVIRVYRIGRMFNDSSSSKKAPTHPYRRPYGVGVQSIEEAKNSLQNDSYLCTVNITSCGENEGNFPDLHRDLIKKMPSVSSVSSMSTLGSSSKLNLATTPNKQGPGSSITFDLSVYDGDLQTVKTEQPMLFSKDITVIPKLSQFDIINPGEVRNDIYLTLMEAQFERGSKKAQKNVEVVVTVIGANGHEIPNCIFYGCGEEPSTHFSSSVSYHDNNPKWQETIKISLPMNDLPGSHLRFDIYHCQARHRAEKKLYGFSFLKVTNNLQIVIKDGSHNLVIFKCEDERKIKFDKYSKQHFLVDDYGDTSKQFGQPHSSGDYERHPKDHLEVHTLLCSTKFTQTTELLGVLNWREEQRYIDQNLDKLMTVQGTEIMKFLQNIMDRLLEMLDDGCSNNAPYCSKVFQVIVFMLNLLLDVRFENFRPVYEDYLQKSFSFPNVYRHLMSQFAAGISSFCAGQPFTLSMAMKVLGELMRLITRSRQLEKESPFDQEESELIFKERLKTLFDNMGRLLKHSEDRLKISQMELLSNFDKCYEPLMKLITKRELADHVVTVITQLPKAKDLPVELRRTKMEFIQKTVNSDLFKDDESRSTLLPLCLNHIKACLSERYFLDLQIATSILGDILEILFVINKAKCISQDIKTLALTLFDVLIQSISKMADGDLMSQQPPSYPQVTNQIPEIILLGGVPVIPLKQPIWEGEMVACLTELLRLMEEPHYSFVIRMYQDKPQLKEFLTQVLHTFQELIKPEMLSSDWTIMRMETNNVIFSAVEYFSQALKNDFLEGECFDQHLWNLYFNLAVEFIVQPSLQLEEYSETKRNKFLERYHDMRVMMGHQIQSLWEKLGTNRRHFIPSMIGPFLKVTLVPEKELRAATLPMFYDMIHCEQKTSGNFVMVEKEIIEKLDMYITMDNQGDTEYKELFQSILLERVQSEPALKDTGSQFIVSVTNLLEKLLDYRQVYDGEENRDKRMQCTFNILNFYRDNKDKRREMYTQYIKKLYDLHRASKNYVEAGLSLQLYAQLLEWNKDEIHSEMGFSPEPQCERKEKLLLEIIDCFDKGKLWEYGIEVCKDLATYYESQLMYRKLSKTLQKEASFFTKILDGVEMQDSTQDQPKFYPRQQPTYFKVAYYGMSFPPFVQNKAFIYRGDECLKLQDIINQLTQEFPGAEILKTSTPVDDTKMYGQAQYIQICNVKPIPDPKNAFTSGLKVPREVESYYEHNDVDTFQFDRSFHQGKKDPNNDFKTLCTERTIMKTNHRFPGILQWYEVVHSETSTFSPVSTAINAVYSACQELEISIETCRRSCSDNNMKDLSRQLNGMITAQVQGGIPKYQEAFFTDEFTAAYPAEMEFVKTLKEKINLQISLLDEGLQVMKKDNSPHLVDLVKSLDEELKRLMKRVGYQKQKKHFQHNDLKKWDSGMGSFIEPRPDTPNSQHSSGSNRSSIISSDSRSNDREDCSPIDLSQTHETKEPQKPVVETRIKGDVTLDPRNATLKKTSSVFVRSTTKPPVPSRKRSDPFPSSGPRAFTGPHTSFIPEEDSLGTPPSIPAKVSTSKLKLLNSRHMAYSKSERVRNVRHASDESNYDSFLFNKLDKDDDHGLTKCVSEVPPLPPRKIRDSVFLPNPETNGNGPHNFSPRGMKLSNSSDEMHFPFGTSPESEPPPIPSHSIPKLPTPRNSAESRFSMISISSNCGLTMSRQEISQNGQGSRTHTSDSVNVTSNSAPPPIPARPTRPSKTSEKSPSNSDSESSNL